MLTSIIRSSRRLRGRPALARAFSTSTIHSTGSKAGMYTASSTREDVLGDTAETSPRLVEFDDSQLVGLTGGEIFEKMMVQLGVKHIFGYPGGAILPVFDGIYASEDVELILPRHEQGGGHMAEGYSRVTGQPGVVLVTSGPGATNTITPLVDALGDGIPLVVFTGQVPTSAIGSDAFQEADVVGISRSATKWNTLVTDIADLPRTIREAFHVAMSGRPGPVLVDLPKNVTAATLHKEVSSTPSLPAFRKRNFLQSKGSREDLPSALKAAATMINNAEKPVLYVGAGCLDCHEDVRAIAKAGNIPVTTTLQGMGIYDELDDLSLHMLGMHGSPWANRLMQQSDCIISLGARFDDRVTGHLDAFAPEARRASRQGRGGFVHFEIMPRNVDKVVKADVAVVGDCIETVPQLVPLITKGPTARNEWLAHVKKEKSSFSFGHDHHVMSEETGVMRPQAVIQELNKQLEHRKEEVIISTGVGQHQMWAAQYYRWRHPRTFVTSGSAGTMGFGLPSAIGAQVAKPDAIVIDIDGDASFSMTGMEMATAVAYNIPVKVLLLNNDFQGMVKQWQDLFYEQRYSGTVMMNPDWVKFAEAMRCKGLRASTEEELPKIIEEFIAHDGPVIMEAVVCKEEHVFPMVPAGKGLHEMVMGKEG